MDSQNPKSYMIRCTNVPTILLEKVIAKRYFTTFGKIRSIRIKRKSQCCIVEYVDKGDMLKALEGAGEYRGHKFQVTEDKTGGTPSGKKGHKTNKVPDEMEELESLREELLSKLRKVDPLHALPKASSKTEKLNTRSPKEAKRRSTTAGFGDENTGIAATVTTSASSSTPSSSNEKDLVQILKQPAHTLEEKFKVLDARDKLLRLRQKKRSSSLNIDPTSNKPGNTGSSHSNKATVGTCPDMCPEKERLQRELQHQVALYEQAQSGGSNNKGVMDQRLAVKQYSRSSADQDAPLPGELRPVEVLRMTMGYLMHKIVGLCNNSPDVNLAEWYHFLWDRTRSIRKDIIQQELCCQKSVELVEQCARFHIYCSARLVAEDPSVFDQKINTENLTKCLQTLKYMYHDLQLKGESCPNEPEFRAYIILLNLNDGNFMWEVQHLRREVQKSPEIRFALKVHSALDQNNYVKFFKLVRSATYLQGCLLMRYFVQMRQSALTILVKCYAPRATQAFIPVADLTRNLAFENPESLVDFCEHYGLSVNSEQSHVICDKTAFTLPEFPYMLDRAVNVLESKQQAMSLGEVVCGKQLPEPVFDGHVPQNSFDSGTGLLSNLSEFLTDFDFRSQQQAVKTDSNQSDSVSVAMATTSVETVEEEAGEIDNNDDDDIMEVEEPKLIPAEQVPSKLLDFSFARSVQQQLEHIDSYDDSGDSRIAPADDKAETCNFPKATSHSVAKVPDLPPRVSSTSVDWQDSSSNTSLSSKKSIFSEFSFAVQPTLTVLQHPASTTTTAAAAAAAASFSFVTAALKDKRDTDVVGSKTIADIAQFTQPPVQQTPAKRSDINVKAKRKLLDDDDNDSWESATKKSQSKIDEYSFVLTAVKAKNNLTEIQGKSETALPKTKERDVISAIDERQLDFPTQQNLDVSRKHPTSDAASGFLRIPAETVPKLDRSDSEKPHPTSDVTKDVRRVLSNLLSKVEQNVKKRRLDEIRALVKRRKLRRVALKWREKARHSSKRRNLDFVPDWISSVSVQEKASQLRIGTQEFAKTWPEFELRPSVPLKKISVHDLVYSVLLSKICQNHRKVQTEIFWKITLSLPLNQPKFQPINKILNDSFAWENKGKSQCHVEHKQNQGGPHLIYCIEKQEGPKKITRADSHGYIFLADTFDLELSQRILTTLRPLGLYVKVPVVIVLSESVKNDSDCLSKLDTLLRENIVSDYLLLVDRFTCQNLPIMLGKSLQFLAENCEKSQNHLQMDFLKRFLQKYLCGEFWRRISSFGKWNSQYKQCLKKFNLMVHLHNEALAKLKAVLLDQRRLEHPEFPEVFRQRCGDSPVGTEEICNLLPCDYRFFPDFWRSNSYNHLLSRILDGLTLPEFDDGKWPPETERDLEIWVAKYCRKVFTKDSERIFYKLMNLLCVQFDLAGNFPENVKKVIFTDLMETIVLEKINQTDFSLSGTEFPQKSPFKEFIVVYDTAMLNQYVTSDWFYLNNAEIKREIQNLLKENSERPTQDPCTDCASYEPIIEDLDFYLADDKPDRKVSLKKMTDDMVRCNLLLRDLSDSYAVHRRIQEKSDDFLRASLYETKTP